VYFPLGGNQVRFPRWALNILIVFVLSGIWHGANWTFLFWGLAHAMVYLFETMIKRWGIFKNMPNGPLAGLFNFLGIIKTFLVVSFIWVLFRADSLGKVKQMAMAFLNNWHKSDDFHIDPRTVILLLGFVVFDFLLKNKRFDVWCHQRHVALRWMIYGVLIFSVIVFSSVDNFPFIYFQF
jgi:D-alanyl-lipoteichoic acid acyltransferase DltB (MBOAT superfamily)